MQFLLQLIKFKATLPEHGTGKPRYHSLHTMEMVNTSSAQEYACSLKKKDQYIEIEGATHGFFEEKKTDYNSL